ncbi:PE-PGRS family protein [Melittangium boletus]|uniref:PE-PGRS family protein n=1 Tax=Melittangium boletus TaxID=83453 RepID=UPI003DA34785
MREMKKLALMGAGCALVTFIGCYDFGQAYEDCLGSGRCPVVCDTSAEDTPGDFQDNDCDGIDGVAAQGVFVDNGYASAEDSVTAGTLEKPYKTLKYALEHATAEKPYVFIAQGVYAEDNLRLTRPLSLQGGYTGVAGGWKRLKTATTTLRKGSIGFTVSVRDSGTEQVPTLEWLNIESEQSASTGAPSIGLRVLSTPRVRLSNMRIVAAAGTAGTAGNNGDSGAAGGAGGAGDSVGTPLGAPANNGGNPGGATCTPGNAGGRGGQGATKNDLTGAAGGQGQPTAAGGTGGRSEIVGSPGDRRGAPGAPGGDGLEGAGGPGGEAGNALGRLQNDTWVALSGTDGRNGESGGAGGGGGGGGSSNLYDTYYVYGAGGGGGGAGGCPGLAGRGGQSGGASIALLLIDSQLTLEASQLFTEGGGAGGRGGSGGAGGAGGEGGTQGTSTSYKPEPQSTAGGGDGGKGGKGGKGGDGGHGGNGASGPSVGVWCANSSVTATGSRFTLGSAGAVGDGPGKDDPTQLKQEEYGCTPSPSP